MILTRSLEAFAVALLASFVLTGTLRRLALRWGLVDLPGPRKVHIKPIPLLGGLAIYLGFVLAILFALREVPAQQIVSIVGGATLLAVVGLLDDAGLLHHQLKLIVGMPLAAVFLLAAGIRAQLFSAFVPGTLGWVLDSCFTIFWVVGITAAFSILDHMDGLCAGIAAIAALFFAIAAVRNGQTMIPPLAAAVLGAALGFLRWNFNPAKIFMGDGGAMMLGFLSAVLALKLRHPASSVLSDWLVRVLILIVPVFDTALVSVSRARRGLLPFASPGKDHTAHRLSNLGLGHRGAVLALYALAALGGGAALFVLGASSAAAAAVAAVFALAAVAAVFFLEAAPYERQAKLHEPAPAPSLAEPRA